jgi:hypothetical protein
MSLYCEGRLPFTRLERFLQRRPPLIQPEDADDSNRAGAHVIEHFVDGLADHMAVAAASRADGAIGLLWEKRTLLISRSDFAINSISIPVIAITLPC